MLEFRRANPQLHTVFALGTLMELLRTTGHTWIGTPASQTAGARDPNCSPWRLENDGVGFVIPTSRDDSDGLCG